MQRGLLHSQLQEHPVALLTSAEQLRCTEHTDEFGKAAPSAPSGQSVFSRLGFVVHHSLQTLRISELEKSSKSAGRQADWREIVHQIPYSGSDPALVRTRADSACLAALLQGWARAACDTARALLLQRAQLSSHPARFCAPSSSSSSRTSPEAPSFPAATSHLERGARQLLPRLPQL